VEVFATMAKVNIEVLDAVIDGSVKGEQLEVDEKSAKHLVEIGYAKRVEVKQAEPEAKPKQKAKK
jgi:hypothetical protein